MLYCSVVQYRDMGWGVILQCSATQSYRVVYCGVVQYRDMPCYTAVLLKTEIWGVILQCSAIQRYGM